LPYCPAEKEKPVASWSVQFLWIVGCAILAIGIAWGKKDATDNANASLNTSAIVELKGELKSQIATLDGKIMALSRDSDRITRLEERYANIADKLQDIMRKLDNPPWSPTRKRR
jgi:hypothetical protein